ncbi:MAG: hypothetical protein JWR67_3531 [Mucilaginibacter sp.]|nr:hypothetical protein [Mucilaginibacter sp.]
MNKVFHLLLLCACTICIKAQTPVINQPTTQDYGKINKEDLEMKTCDFETDANAEILFDKGNIYYDQDFNIIMERHKRIKIFNDNGKENANIRIEFYNTNHYEDITGLQAETINLNDGKIEITKIDKKLVYTQTIDKQRAALVFTMPNVKAGSVIEFKYKWQTNSYSNFPDWYFQHKIPARYSEVDTEIPEYFEFAAIARPTQSYVKNITSSESKSILSTNPSNPISYTANQRIRAMANIKSLPDEAYMSSSADNLQSILFHLTTIRPINGFIRTGTDTWAKVGTALVEDEDFGRQLKKKLTNEDVIINKAKTFKTNDEKIAYVFNEVKNTIKWDGNDAWYTNDGTSRAWERKSGNSAEVNLILYHLLNASGVKAFPMVVSTREHGKVYPGYTFLYQFNRAVVYIPVDSTKKYVLDATNKYNTYNETPDNLLNSFGLWIDKDNKIYDLAFLKKDIPVRQIVLINADIKPDGKMTGTTQISSISYNRINSIKRYNTDGEKKYIDYLRDNDNNLKILSIKFDNMQVDTLPLTQNIDFTLDLTGSDENYIYFNPNLFTSLHNNPFLSETRYTDIDFGYLHDYQISGNYKIPAGYKVDALPKNISMVIPDKSISFKRIIAEQGGTIVVRYVIYYKKTIYFKEDYADIREFYKKMHEMLNEQIVLKKS